jgi:succinyl-CoA synthetase beta subunit
MIAEVKAFATLKGFRGQPVGDLDALARATVVLSQLALQNDPAIAEAEVNPLIVKTDGVVAVDALIRTQSRNQEAAHARRPRPARE